jgi:Soluble lytic murein transglycosylase and related regulatory proteins (some contain LysM/invasin domains)
MTITTELDLKLFSIRKNKKTASILRAAVFALAAVLALCSCSFGEKYIKKYEDEVLASSEEYGLDPALVFAVIRTESSFDPNAVSRAGAKGLMQIMPATAEWVAFRTKTEFDESRIFEPGYNINIGCHLLSYLLEKYNGDLRFALAAYNAGAGRVDSWLADPEYFDGEELSIPFTETKNYVEKVLKAYEKYKEMDEE